MRPGNEIFPAHYDAEMAQDNANLPRYLETSYVVVGYFKGQQAGDYLRHDQPLNTTARQDEMHLTLNCLVRP